MTYPYPVKTASMKGFSILQALISLFIFASITLSAINWQRFTSNVDIGHHLGQQYQTLNAAVNNYIVTYYQPLSTLNPACSQMTFTTVNPASAPTTERVNANCAITIATGKTVANGFQPSPAELIMLGLLPASPTVMSTNLLQIESPNIPSTQVVYEYMPSVPAHSGPSQARLFINIQMVCVQRGSLANPNTGNAIPTTPSVTGCPSDTTTTALQSLTFNTQPYNNHQKSYSFTFPALLGSAFTTLGDDALSSGMTDVTLLHSGSTLKGKNFQLANPIVGGPSGIMALRGGYGASYAMQHSRVDGSNPPTADWSFGGHSLSDVNNFHATAISESKLKLPVQVLGSGCDAKEDIALDATANLLICRNSIWSTLHAGTIDFSKFYIMEVSADQDYSPDHPRYQFYNYFHLFDCVNNAFSLCAHQYISNGAIAINNDMNNHVVRIDSLPQKVSDYFPVVMKYTTDNRDGNNDRDMGVDIYKNYFTGQEANASWKFDIYYTHHMHAYIYFYKINK